VLYQSGTFLPQNTGTGVRTTRFYPRFVNSPERGSLEIRRVGGQPNNPLSEVITTITLENGNPVIPNFYISGIDGNSAALEKVEIIGYCNGNPFYPALSYATTPLASSYSILGNKATAKRTVNMAATNRNGRLNVTFSGGVSSIVIKYGTIRRRSNSIQRLFISPITLNAVFPTPMVNEEGLAFWINASPRQQVLCREVDYTFNIENVNCDNKPANFIFKLPEGLRWDCHSLSIDEIYIEDATIFCDGTTLTIDNLTLWGADITTFSAKAYFELNALPGTYNTRATIYYDKIEDYITVPDSLESYDYVYGNMPTIITGIPGAPRLMPLEVDITLESACFIPNDTLLATITIYNPNGQHINEAALDVTYNEDFGFVPGSLNSETLTLSPPEFYDDGDGNMVGGLWRTELDILEGRHEITFKVVAPANLEPDYDMNGMQKLDEKGNLLYAPLWFLFEFSSISEDEDYCGDEAFRYAYGDTVAYHIPDVTIDGPTTLCIGETTNLSRWLGGTWTCSDPEVASIEQTDTETIVTAVKGGTTSFWFTLDNSDCIAVSGELTVNEPEVFGNNSVCVGETIVLSTFVDGVWMSTDVTIATISPQGELLGVRGGLVNIIFTDDEGCTTTKEITVNYTPAPVVPHTAIAYWQNADAPDLVTATEATPHTNCTLQWYNSNEEPINEQVEEPINTSVSDIYIYYVSQIDNITGCEGEKVQVRVLIVEPYAPAYIACPGVPITAGVVNEIAGITFHWFDSVSSDLELLGSPSKTRTVTMNDPVTLLTFYVEPREDTHIYNRLMIEIEMFRCRTTLLGTVFPFVNRGYSAFDALFSITASLKSVPANLLSPTVYQTLLAATPLYPPVNAIYYDGTIFVKNTPKSPGALGEFNNYGLPIDFEEALGGTIVHGLSTSPILLEFQEPDIHEGATVGLFVIDDVTPGSYILEIKRAGYMVRWTKITVNPQDSTLYLGHRELIPGDVVNFLIIDNDDAQLIINKIKVGIYYGHIDYEPAYDLNADGFIDSYDLFLLKKYINFRFLHYRETKEWIDGY
jgi:hypothetical protein